MINHDTPGCLMIFLGYRILAQSRNSLSGSFGPHTCDILWYIYGGSYSPLEMGSSSQKAKQREPEVLRQAKQRLKVTLVFFWRKNGGPHLQKSAKWMQMDPNGSISGPKLKPLRVMLILESNSDTCFGSLLNLVFYSADIWFGRGVVMQRICNKINKDFSFCLGRQLAFHRFHNPRGIHEKKAATVLVYRVGLKFRDTTKCMLWVVMGKLWTHSKPWYFRVLYFQTIWNHQSFKMHFSQVRRMMPRRDSDARACRKQNRTLWMDLSDLRSLCQGVAMPPHQQHQMHPHWTSKVACCALKSLLFSCNWVMQWNLQICLIISMFQTSNHRNLGVPNSTLTHFWCEFQSWT